MIPLVALILDEPFVITLATKVAVLALAGVGLNLALGYGGLVSFGHAAFFGIGGYASGILASSGLAYTPIFTWPIEISGTTQMLIIWPVAMIAATLAALLIGALSLRTSGIFFIMITLAFGQMFFFFAISCPHMAAKMVCRFTSAAAFPASTRWPDPVLRDLLYPSDGGDISGLEAWRITLRLALQAARQNRQRLSAVGIRPFGVLLVAFAISGAITGLAGALFADLNRFVSPSMLSWQTSGEILIFVILGGVGRLFGHSPGPGCSS